MSYGFTVKTWKEEKIERKYMIKFAEERGDGGCQGSLPVPAENSIH